MIIGIVAANGDPTIRLFVLQTAARWLARN
jgi:hypothetical protein